MLSSIMETVLVKFLGKYVDGIKNNIDINILTNVTTIEKISVRPEFINSLGLPFVLKYSHISKIQLNVPWSNLKQKPTTVSIQGLYILLSLKYDDEEFDIDPNKKLKPLINRVKEQIKKKWEQKDGSKSQTFAEKSITRIIDNLVVSIDQIHIRVESMKRGWDFSFGVILDKISSITVNEYGQKTFYSRHFTNKQLNQPLKKSFVCERFEVYFNDEEDFFITEKSKPDEIKTLMMEPFQNKYQGLLNSPLKKNSSSSKLPTQFKMSYKMKILTKFSFDIIAEQKLSSDKRYIVEVKGQLPKVCFNVSDIQLSQILVILELMYEWVLDKQKNGRRDNIFNEKIENEFKRILLKMSKEEKLTTQQMQNLFTIASETPIDKLENSADNLIKDYRIEKEMKKISKVTNKEKSKEMIEKLFQRIENQNQQVLQLFQHIVIQLNIPQFKLQCMKNNKNLFEIGFSSIMGDIKLVLTKHNYININISQVFLNIFNQGVSKNLIKLEKPQYCQQPFANVAVTLLNKSPPVIKNSIKKRYIELNQYGICTMLEWLGRIKLKPPILNFIDQQLNYSIHITQQIFAVLFGHADLSLHFQYEFPILALHFEQTLQVDFGTMQFRRQNVDQYCLEYTTEQKISIDGNEILAFDPGNKVTFLNVKPENVRVEIAKLRVHNIGKVFKFADYMIKNAILAKVKKFSIIVQEEIIFQGKFQLNEYKHQQNMLLSGNYLKFIPSGQSICLLRTKMYPFERKGRYGLIFRQEVQKHINIVFMDSQKTMFTLFETIRDHMLKICTISQWKKYYQKFPNDIVTSIDQIKSQEQNLNLIDLSVTMAAATINFGHTSLGDSMLNLNQVKSTINYKEYNTDAKVEIGSLSLSLGKQKIIQNLSIGTEYTYVDFMSLAFNILMFKINVDNYEVIEQIINLSAEYSLQCLNLVKTFKETFPPLDEPDFIDEKIPSAEDISYLLQTKVYLKVSNFEAFVIGFRNNITTASFALEKYRNTPNPNIFVKIMDTIILSSITLSQCELSVKNNKIDVEFVNLVVNMSFQLLFYELTSGKGSSFVSSIMNVIQKRKKSEKKSIDNKDEKGIPSINAEIKGLKYRLRLTDSQQVSSIIQSVHIKVNPNESQKELVDARISWQKLTLIINSNIILEPLSGKTQILSNKEFIPIKVVSSIQPIIVNISVHKLFQSVFVMKISLERMLTLDIVKQLFTEKLTAMNPRLQAISKQLIPQVILKIDSIFLILYNFEDWQLIRVKIDNINLNTQKSKQNEIEVSVQHLNSILRIYEPVIQKTKIQMSITEGPQAIIKLDDIRLNISEQFIKDVIKEFLITKKNIEKSMKQSKIIYHKQDYKATTELEKYKSIIKNMIAVTNIDLEGEEGMEDRKMERQFHNTNTFLFRNNIKAEVLAEVKIDETKTVFQLKQEHEEKQVKFKVKSQYKESFQMVEKYKKVLIKISLIHPDFYTQSFYFSIFLHKNSYTYQKTIFYDQTGQQTNSCVGLFIHHKPNECQYIMDIIPPFKVLNSTMMKINVNWIKGKDHYHRQLQQGQFEWVSPWVVDKVTINPNSQNIYASSFSVDFSQQHALYEVNLNKSTGSEEQNYCCLTIERELFQGQKKSKLKQILQPGVMIIKPTYYAINHFHNPIIINGLECKHKQKVPLYSMFRTKKMQQFFKLQMGDGSMHQVYLPKDGQSITIQLKLKNRNYITVIIHRQKTEQPRKNECIYHIYSKLQLSINFPRSEQLVLKTNILSNLYIVKKHLQLNDITYEFDHPSVIDGNQNSLTKDRFIFYTSVHILDEFEKYLQIKSNHFYSKQLTLYPSYYGNDIYFYKQVDPEKYRSSEKGKDEDKEIKEQILKKYSINYEFTKICSDIVMYYVTILPKYYLLNLSQQVFNIDGQNSIKYNERVVIDSDSVQIIASDHNCKWQMLHNSISVDLSTKKQLIFFKQVNFHHHQINYHLKSQLSEEMQQIQDSKSVVSLISKVSQKVEGNQIEGKPIQIEGKQKSIKKASIPTQNIKIFQIFRHIGSHSAVNFCIKEWNEWINVHNNLDKNIIVISTWQEDNLQISFETPVRAGESANHPYGIERMPTVAFYIENEGERVQLSKYKTTNRFNDQIQLTYPGLNEENPRTQMIIIYQVKVSRGRKVIFSFANVEDPSENDKKIRSLIIPAFLKISESLKVKIGTINAAFIVGTDKGRRQMIRFSSRNIDLLMLVYPSGLYMIKVSLAIELQAPLFPDLVLDVPSVEFYLEAVQSKFIENVGIKIEKQIHVLLTDKLIFEVVNSFLKIVKQIKQEKTIFSSDEHDKIIKHSQNDGFFTSNLNSVSISEINAKVTIKKVLIDSKQEQKKLVNMGISIIQLEKSKIALPKVSIQQPINALHINAITKKYVMEIIIGCLGGMNLIGNPKQFIQEIQAGTSRGKPIIGFVGGVLAGTSNSISKILSTVSNSVSQLSMDEQYHRQRNQTYMNQPKGFIGGVKQGSKSLFTSLKSGVVGLYKRPKQGLEQQGGIGLLKGTFEGLAGVIVKSVTGVIDAASMTVRGIKSASSYSLEDQNSMKFFEKPLYHNFKIIRPYDKINEIVYNSLLRINKQSKGNYEDINIVEACILEDENNVLTDEAVIITSEKLYVINYEHDRIQTEIINEKMNATGKFLEGVVLYYNQNQPVEEENGEEDDKDNGEEIVFRIGSNQTKKQKLYLTLKAFVDLYSQSKDKDFMPE